MLLRTSARRLTAVGLAITKGQYEHAEQLERTVLERLAVRLELVYAPARRRRGARRRGRARGPRRVAAAQLPRAAGARRATAAAPAPTTRSTRCGSSAGRRRGCKRRATRPCSTPTRRASRSPRRAPVSCYTMSSICASSAARSRARASSLHRVIGARPRRDRRRLREPIARALPALPRDRETSCRSTLEVGGTRRQVDYVSCPINCLRQASTVILVSQRSAPGPQRSAINTRTSKLGSSQGSRGCRDSQGRMSCVHRGWWRTRASPRVPKYHAVTPCCMSRAAIRCVAGHHNRAQSIASAPISAA